MAGNKKNPCQLERFSSGFYDYDITDKVLLKVINARVPKHLRGNELKKMALLYLMEQEPNLYNQIYSEVVEESKGVGGINMVSKLSTANRIIQSESVQEDVQNEDLQDKVVSEVQKEVVCTSTQEQKEVSSAKSESGVSLADFNDCDVS